MGCSPGMHACPATCGHKLMVNGYREEYQRQNDALWEKSGGYPTEYLDNKRQLREAGTPLPQFKDWLKGHKREPVKEDRPPMTAEQRAVQEMAGIDWASNPVQGEVRDGQSFLRFASIQDSNEGMLLATGLNSDKGVEAIRALDLKEFNNPFHQDTARAITWLAARDQPHDAAAVTALLREHDRLPLEMDPTVPLFEVDPELYGLGAWQTYAPPTEIAPAFAQAVRSEYRSREMEAICTRGANAARAAIEYGDSGMVANDMVGQVRMTMANELREFPPALDENLRPVRSGSTMDAQVLPGQPTLGGPGKAPETLVELEKVNVIDNDLRLPPPPVLSAASREALSRA